MKTSTLLISGLMAISLSACGATTGSVAKSMAKQAAMTSVSSTVSPAVTPAQTAAPVQLAAQAGRIDGDMSCEALAAEMAQLDASIAASNSVISGAGSADVATGLAMAGASQAALHTGAVGALAKVPFGGLFARKAMDTAANASRIRTEQAQADIQSANLRKASLIGLYAGKDCAS